MPRPRSAALHHLCQPQTPDLRLLSMLRQTPTGSAEPAFFHCPIYHRYETDQWERQCCRQRTFMFGSSISSISSLRITADVILEVKTVDAELKKLVEGYSCNKSPYMDVQTQSIATCHQDEPGPMCPCLIATEVSTSSTISATLKYLPRQVLWLTALSGPECCRIATPGCGPAAVV